MAYTIEGELRSIYQINDPITAADSKRLAEAMASLGSDFIPGYGDGKAFVEAQDCSGLLIPDTDLGENPRRERGV